MMAVIMRIVGMMTMLIRIAYTMMILMLMKFDYNMMLMMVTRFFIIASGSQIGSSVRSRKNRPNRMVMPTPLACGSEAPI